MPWTRDALHRIDRLISKQPPVFDENGKVTWDSRAQTSKETK